MSDPTRNHTLALSRRAVLAGTAALALPLSARAYSVEKARALIDDVVAEVNRIINSGKSESAMISDFQKLFQNYADIPWIAPRVLGPPWRSASGSQRSAFTRAFEGYMARKYGRRFREFIGGRVEVQSAKAVKSFYEVLTVTHMQGVAPFDVIYVVSDESERFIDMVIEGISLVKAEREEIGVMLDKRRGDIDLMIQDLNAF
jgi:phospholipid transport system substrate-binding protein